MLILLDENLPHSLRHLIGPHDVRTVAYQGWCGITNGNLLRTAEDFGFDLFITGDRGLQYQQNRQGQRMAILVLRFNDRGTLLKGSDKVAASIEWVIPGTIRRLDLND